MEISDYIGYKCYKKGMSVDDTVKEIFSFRDFLLACSKEARRQNKEKKKPHGESVK